MGNFNSKSYIVQKKSQNTINDSLSVHNRKSKFSLDSLDCGRIGKFKRGKKPYFDKPKMSKNVMNNKVGRDFVGVVENQLLFSVDHYSSELMNENTPKVSSIQNNGKEKTDEKISNGNSNEELTKTDSQSDSTTVQLNTPPIPDSPINSTDQKPKASYSASEIDISPHRSQPYGLASESSLRSDDILLVADMNIDPGDDDVSKDYQTTEKDDPYNYGLNEQLNMSHSNSNDYECEKSDMVYFDSSRESSASLHRKLFTKGFQNRPHSFSTPLQQTNRRSTPSSVVESVDVAWTWISASESANLAQEIASLKLMLLRMKKLLTDDILPENLSVIRSSNQNILSMNNVFSEPSTPLSPCDANITLQSTVPELRHNPDWINMSKDTLLQAVQNLNQENTVLQFQLKEKDRIIDILKEKSNQRNYPKRYQSVGSRDHACKFRINRSSTFETASVLHREMASQD